MNKLEFRLPPHETDGEIPFAPNESAFAQWLEGLPSESDYVTCCRLTLALQTLNKMDLNPRFRYGCLDRVLPLINEVSGRLEKAYLDSGFPLTSEEISSVETLVWAYTQLTMSFSDLSHQLEFRNDDWTEQEKAQVSYSAMYAASQVLLYVSQVYADVQKGFWLNCYQNYMRSKRHGLLHVPVNVIDKNDTIDSIFKQMLIFACCDTDCFRVREMNTLYGLLKDCVEPVRLVDTIKPERVRGIFRIDMDGDEGPKKIFKHADAPAQNAIHYVDALPVVNHLITAVQQREDKKSDYRFVDKDLVVRVTAVLTQKHNRKYTRFSISENAKGFIGFKPIVSMLAKIQSIDIDTLPVKTRNDPRIAGRWQVPELDLVPKGDEQAYNLKQKMQHSALDEKVAKIHRLGALASGNKDIWSKPENVELLKEIPSGDFFILNSSIKGYALIWKPEDQRIKVGELFAVQQQDDERLEIGMIRRISRLKDETFRLGIELMGMQSELVWLAVRGINKQPGQMAILIPADPVLRQPDSIVLGSHDLKPEQEVDVHRGDKKNLYRIGKLLHMTAALQHFELLVSNENTV